MAKARQLLALMLLLLGRFEAHSAQNFFDRPRPLIGRSFINRFLDQSERRIDDLGGVSVPAECASDLPTGSEPPPVPWGDLALVPPLRHIKINWIMQTHIQFYLLFECNMPSFLCCSSDISAKEKKVKRGQELY